MIVQLAEWSKNFGQNNGHRGDWHEAGKEHKREEHGHKNKSKESKSASHEHDRAEHRQKHTSKEDNHSHEAYKTDGILFLKCKS